LVIKHGADVNIQSSEGPAPIHVAAATANYESVRILVENGPGVNMEDNEGKNALKHAFGGLPID
jgi:ankyrin repeat protein